MLLASVFQHTGVPAQLKSILSLLLLASALSLTAGGYLLYINSLVPTILVETTIVAIVILFVLSYLVGRGNLLAMSVSTILGVVAPIMSAMTPQHIGVLEQIGTGGLLLVLGFLQFFGFYVFPITFVIIRVALRSRFPGWK